MRLLLLWCMVIMPFFLYSQKKTVAQRVDSLMRILTLEEKIGQLNQYTGNWEATGPAVFEQDKLEQIKQGKVGSMLNVHMVDRARQIQEIAMQSPRKIPLLFGLDVVHGYKTVFPLPLAEAASWDMKYITLAARIAATETAASGVHWSFAPMVDISRDPRWGRVMEGAGEDPFLGASIARARVTGFQGKGLGDTTAIMACAKHFAAYGAAIAGRDYNTVDISKQTLHEVYLPPFKAAVDAGAATLMNAFNEINGIPATAHKYILRDVLKKQWGFKGFVVSDWGSIWEMTRHGNVANNKEAALAAILAGNDMDMESRAYRDHLLQLVKEQKVSVAVVEDAVRRILFKKFEMGLFEDPYKFMNAQRQQQAWNNPEHKKATLQMAERSIVLLKNDTLQGKPLLPLDTRYRKIGLIGPLAHAKQDMQGFWCVTPDSNAVTTIYDAMQQHYGNNAQILYTKGCNVTDSTHNGFMDALTIARESDIVVVAVGEKWNMTGEAKSKVDIHLPGVQEDLIKALYAIGKPMVVLVAAGRPLIFNWTAERVPAIVNTWLLGDMAGKAIVNVLTGAYNPSGKLPMTFPRHIGQVPVFYAQKNTGRPSFNENRNYTSAYIDITNRPQYAFGHGLSYTNFAYSNVEFSDTVMKPNGAITVSCTIKNTGALAGEEVVQLYIQDKVASITRPVKELKGFEKISLLPGEAKKVSFVINKSVLQFYNENLDKWIIEPGAFDIMIGSASDNIALHSTIYVKSVSGSITK
jgi:beta-glucosidase